MKTVPARVFQSVFSEECAELEASDGAIADADDSQLRTLRLQRQRKLLWDAKIELTVQDEVMATEQSAAVNDSMQVMIVLLGLE